MFKTVTIRKGPLWGTLWTFGSQKAFLEIDPKDKQGDKIRRIFAHWVVVYLGSFLKIIELARILGLCTFPRL
jgi:hypothetical protein